MYSPNSRRQTFYPGQQTRTGAAAQKTTSGKAAASVANNRYAQPQGHSQRSKKKQVTVVSGASTASFSPKADAVILKTQVKTEIGTSTRVGNEVSVVPNKRGDGKKNSSINQTAGNSYHEVSPYYNSNLNSYVKSQNYYKKFFHKKMPVALSNVQVPGQPQVVHNATDLRPVGAVTTQTRDKSFFRNRNSVNKQCLTQGNGSHNSRTGA